jgi:hypothetical protein
MSTGSIAHGLFMRRACRGEGVSLAFRASFTVSAIHANAKKERFKRKSEEAREVRAR